MSNQVKQLTLSAFFLALGLVLPFAFHSFGPQAGTVFLPMHIPVLLCGFVCGPAYGALVGMLTPLLSSALTGMPPLMPTGIAMCVELSTYGFLSGWMTKKLPLYPFFNYHDAGRKGSQRTCQPGAAEHGTQGIYHADIFNCRLCYCDTRHCAAAGDDTASCECREKAGGQKSRGLMQSNRQFCCVCFHICRREECMRLGNRCAVFLFY